MYEDSDSETTSMFTTQRNSSSPQRQAFGANEVSPWTKPSRQTHAINTRSQHQRAYEAGILSSHALLHLILPLNVQLQFAKDSNNTWGGLLLLWGSSYGHAWTYGPGAVWTRGSIDQGQYGLGAVWTRGSMDQG